MPIPTALSILLTAGLSCWNPTCLVRNPTTDPEYQKHCNAEMCVKEEAQIGTLYHELPRTIQSRLQTYDTTLTSHLRVYTQKCPSQMETSEELAEWATWDAETVGSDIRHIFCPDDAGDECQEGNEFLEHVIIGLDSIQNACTHPDTWAPRMWVERAMEKVDEMMKQGVQRGN